ncbi:MAG: esterase family protein [Ruminococcus sp.]|nr:esterase family protein [Ruminococcus sp.]
MKKFIKKILCISISSAVIILSGCNTNGNISTADTAAKISNSTAQTVGTIKTNDETGNLSEFDPYAIENDDNVPDNLIEKHDGVDYGTIDKDVEYYSSNAKDNKKCNVLLPAGYDNSKKYPVLYAIHGWGGDYTGLIHEDSFLHILYGNMLEQGLTVPMIIVSVDMYTDILADKENKKPEEMRLCYDKVVYDIKDDLMPFIESRYSVLTGSDNTAIAGQSQGGVESLATAFTHQGMFGYIGSYAPATGAIPTEYFKDTYWNWPILDDFVIEDEKNTPKYIYMSVGSKDPWDIEPTLYYGEVMTKNGIRNQTDFVEGYEHDYIFWRLCYYNFLKKIFR